MGAAVGTLERLKRMFGPRRDEPTIETVTYRGPDRRAGERLVSGTNAVILVVDDSKTIVSVLRKMLLQNNFTVLTAGDGAEAVEIACNRQPSLIFLDIVMPGMNGFSALRELRRREQTRDIPIIMMSGNEQATEEFYVQRIGADDFMKKPFSRAEVFARIERLLDKNRLLLPDSL